MSSSVGRILILISIGFLLASCQVPGGGSVYGDRPGPQGFRSVVLDAGHGGKDSGAISRGQMEKRLALDVAKRVRRELGLTWKVTMTRDSDVFIPLDDRARIASKKTDAILVSIHFNHGPRRVAGPETYYWRTDSYSLATRLHRNLSAAAPNKSRSRGLVRRRLRLTRNPTIPCVLVECGYLSNPKEAALVKSSAYLDKLAKAIASAIKEQSAQGDAGMGPLPKPIYAAPSKNTDARDRF